jgi:uncharacterized protein
VTQTTITGTRRGDALWTKLATKAKAVLEIPALLSELHKHQPQLLVCSGAASLAIAAKRARFMPATGKVIFIGAPHHARDDVDIVVASSHEIADKAAARAKQNIILMDGVPAAPVVNDASYPGIAVLIGGTNKAYSFTEAPLILQLKLLCEQYESMSIVFSRRTPEALEASIRRELTLLRVQFVAANDRNGFQTIMSTASAFAVTPDSITMTCEALATGRPISMLELPLTNPDTPTHRFVQIFKSKGYVGSLGSNTQAPQQPWRETDRVAAEINLQL